MQTRLRRVEKIEMLHILGNSNSAEAALEEWNKRHPDRVFNIGTVKRIEKMHGKRIARPLEKQIDGTVTGKRIARTIGKQRGRTVNAMIDLYPTDGMIFTFSGLLEKILALGEYAKGLQKSQREALEKSFL